MTGWNWCATLSLVTRSPLSVSYAEHLARARGHAIGIEGLHARVACVDELLPAAQILVHQSGCLCRLGQVLARKHHAGAADRLSHRRGVERDDRRAVMHRLE